MNFFSIHVCSRERLLDDGSRLGDAWFPQLEVGTGSRGPGDFVGLYRLMGLRLLGRCDIFAPPSWAPGILARKSLA